MMDVDFNTGDSKVDQVKTIKQKKPVTRVHHDSNQNISQRQQSLDKYGNPLLKDNVSSQSTTNENTQAKKQSSKIIKIGQRERVKPIVNEDHQIKMYNNQRYRSPMNQNRGNSSSVKKRETIQVINNTNVQKQFHYKLDNIFIKPRANSPKPQPMPNKFPTDQKPEGLSKKLNNLVDKFNSKQNDQVQNYTKGFEIQDKKELQIQDELYLIDQRIHSHKQENNHKQEMNSQNSISYQPSYQHQHQTSLSSPLETELSKTIKFLREENDRLRQRGVMEKNESSDHLIKELNSQINLKNHEIVLLRQGNEDITNEFMDLQNKVTDDETEKKDLQDLIQKLRFELDSQNQQIKKLMVEQEKHTKTMDPQTPVVQTDAVDFKVNSEMSILKNSLTDCLTRNKLFQQKNDQLMKMIADYSQNTDDQLLYQIAEMEFKLKDLTGELDAVTQDRDQLRQCIKSYSLKELQNQRKDTEIVTQQKGQKINVGYHSQSMDEIGRELVKTKQQLAEVINAALELGGSDLVDLIDNIMNSYS